MCCKKRTINNLFSPSVYKVSVVSFAFTAKIKVTRVTIHHFSWIHQRTEVAQETINQKSREFSGMPKGRRETKIGTLEKPGSFCYVQLQQTLNTAQFLVRLSQTLKQRSVYHSSYYLIHHNQLSTTKNYLMLTCNKIT